MCNRDREGRGGEDGLASFIGGEKGAGFKIQSATCTMDGRVEDGETGRAHKKGRWRG